MENILCSELEEFQIVKMLILPKAIYRFKALPIRILMAFFMKVEKTIPKLTQNQKIAKQ